MYEQAQNSSKVNSNKIAQSQLQPRPFAVQPQIETHSQEGKKPKLQSDDKKLQRAGFNLMDNIMAANTSNDPPRIQLKLEIGEVGDQYEKEADRVASQVVSQINQPVQKKLQRLSEAEVIQRKAESASERPQPFIKPLQRASQTEIAQRREEIASQTPQKQLIKPFNIKSQNQSIQRQGAIGGGTASADLESSIQSARGSGQSLDPNLQQSMGQAMGADFSGVKVHTDSQSDQLNKSIQAKAFTTGQDVFFRQGAYEPSSRGGQELIAHELTHVVQQNGGAVQSPSPQNSTSTNTNSPSSQPIQRKFDQDTIDKLEKHIGSKAKQQKLVSSEGHGQGMAEELARGGDGQNENVDNFAGGEGKYIKKGFRAVGHGQYKKNWKSDGSSAVGQESAPEVMSQTLMNLVRLTKYDDTASASVLELANGGKDLQDQEMWNLIVVNSKFMSYIQTGMTINKIIPDSTVQNVLNIKQNDATYGTSVGGSVAHEKNYDQGLTGEEATANFGLDYGGYQAGTLKANGTDAGASTHSSYVYDTAADDKGRTLKAVPNVFYMKIAIPENKLADVKVPVHGNVKSWAENKLLDIQTTIGDPVLLPKLAEEAGAKDSAEMLASLSKKIEILTQFVSRAKVDPGMLTTLTADQKKNKEDPLTNMGMTKPSSRLQTSFGTINQEYHIGYFPVPEGSGLWLKDATGVDTLVGQFIPNPANSNIVEWGNLNNALIEQKLSENEALRT